MALKGIRVIEMAGLAPAPFCGLLLSDFGARVLRVERPNTQTFCLDRLTRGKESISMDLTREKGQRIFLDLCKQSDVIIDPYRPGVMEALKIGPQNVLAENSKMIFARLSGYGQEGPLSKKAGHDINFLAMSGVLSMLGAKNSKPQPPQNLLGDFGGGGLLCAFGILAALLERNISGKGQVLDANITDGSAYLSTWLWRADDLPFWGTGRGSTWFDGGVPFYDTYECLDGKFVAVGCLEKAFFDQLLKGLGIPKKYDQSSDHDKLRTELTDIFRTKTRDDWVAHFRDMDACVTPVLSMEEAPQHPHHVSRKAFISTKGHFHENTYQRAGPEPRPTPGMSRTPANVEDKLREPQHHGEDTEKVLHELGYSKEDIEIFIQSGIVQTPSASQSSENVRHGSSKFQL